MGALLAGCKQAFSAMGGGGLPETELILGTQVCKISHAHPWHRTTYCPGSAAVLCRDPLIPSPVQLLYIHSFVSLGPLAASTRVPSRGFQNPSWAL